MNPALSGKNYDLIMRRIGDLPALPTLVNKIVEQLGNNNVPASEIAKLVSFDPGLTTKFLRLVNSSAYGFQRQIGSVQHAIMILGFNSVRGIVLSAGIFKMFEGRSSVLHLDPKAFWRHSLATAMACQFLAVRLKTRWADDAFSAGMLHDIGKMILAYYFSAEYATVLQAAHDNHIAGHGEPFLMLEQAHLGLNHAELGYQLAIRWKLPHTINEVIRYHHQPSAAKDSPELVYLVALANGLVNCLGQKHNGVDWQRIPEDVLAYFHFSPEDPHPLNLLFNDLCDQLDDLESLLESLQAV